MSAHLMIVAGYLPLPTPAHKLALMKICDSADDRNRLGFPGMDTVRIWADVKKSRCLQLLKDLQELGLLMQVEKAHRGRRAVFKVFPEPGDEVFSVSMKSGQRCPGADRFRGVPAIPRSDEDIAALLRTVDDKRSGTSVKRAVCEAAVRPGGDGSAESDPVGKGPPQWTLADGSTTVDPSPSNGSNQRTGKGPTGVANGSGVADPFGSFLRAQSSVPPSGNASARETGLGARPPDSGQQATGSTTGGPEPAEAPERAAARKVADDWWRFLEAAGTPAPARAGSRAYWAFVSQLENRFAAGYRVVEVKAAIRSLYERFDMLLPPPRSLDRELTAARRLSAPACSRGPAEVSGQRAADELAEVFDDEP